MIFGLRDLWRCFFAKPVAPSTSAYVSKGTPTEETDADWLDGYSTGRAHGQLEGRQALAMELEQEFGIGQPQMTADDARRIKSRQVH